jgi:hypothetical protein
MFVFFSALFPPVYLSLNLESAIDIRQEMIFIKFLQDYNSKLCTLVCRRYIILLFLEGWTISLNYLVLALCLFPCVDHFNDW